MITKKQAMKKTRESEGLVYTNLSDIYHLIHLHATLGMDDMEVFVEKKSAGKFSNKLMSKGFYCRITPFEALEYECRLYVSWLGNY
jgi:hypothetical protein